MSVQIHDHFSGLAHCIECNGWCSLSGQDKAVTSMVRYTMEFFSYAHDGWMPSFIEESLCGLLGPDRLKIFRQHVRENCPKHVKASQP